MRAAATTARVAAAAASTRASSRSSRAGGGRNSEFIIRVARNELEFRAAVQFSARPTYRLRRQQRGATVIKPHDRRRRRSPSRSAGFTYTITGVESSRISDWTAFLDASLALFDVNLDWRVQTTPGRRCRSASGAARHRRQTTPDDARHLTPDYADYGSSITDGRSPPAAGSRSLVVTMALSEDGGAFSTSSSRRRREGVC